MRTALSQLARCGIANASIGTCHDAHLDAELTAAKVKQDRMGWLTDLPLSQNMLRKGGRGS
jgi:hypothetical protein